MNLSWAWAAEGRRELLGGKVGEVQRRWGEAGCSVEVLEQQAGLWPSLCSHGEATAELRRKPFDQRVMEKDHIISGSEGGGG